MGTASWVCEYKNWTNYLPNCIRVCKVEYCEHTKVRSQFNSMMEELYIIWTIEAICRNILESESLANRNERLILGTSAKTDNVGPFGTTCSRAQTNYIYSVDML